MGRTTSFREFVEDYEATASDEERAELEAARARFRDDDDPAGVRESRPPKPSAPASALSPESNPETCAKCLGTGRVYPFKWHPNTYSPCPDCRAPVPESNPEGQ